MPIRAETLFDGAVERLVLDQPKGNVLDSRMVDGLRGKIQKLGLRQGLRLVIFEGAGRHFSFGASVEEHLPARVDGMLANFHGLFFDIERLGVPTAAIVRGQCLGGGLELATWCGRVFCDPTAVFAVPEVKLAVFPPVAAMSLRWRIGGARATSMIISGERIDGVAAAALGLADECVDGAGAAALRWYEENLAELSPVGLRIAWIAARRPMARALHEELPELERLYLLKLMALQDPVEGLTAFLERREPVWAS
jgi:cyclohexa-1,5-dienecarbonyl-CoA hydratase